MSGTLFDQTLAPRRRNRRSFGTVTVSVMLHAAALVVVLALQLTSSIQGLIIASPLPAFVVPQPSPPPPVVPPAPPPARIVTAPAPVLNVSVATTVPLDSFQRESIRLVGPSGPPMLPGPMVGPPGAGLMSLTSGIDQVSFGPPPRPAGPMRVGGSIVAPTRLVYVPPVYPSVAQTAKVEGEVTLEATIDANGVVQNVVVLQSVPLLDRAAIEAVGKWRYSPTRLNGQPVAVIMLVRVKFTLK